MQFGVHATGETPVLIPNTEVKTSRGDYTDDIVGKLARCQIIQKLSERGVFVFFGESLFG